MDVRVLRLLRVFLVFKLAAYVEVTSFAQSWLPATARSWCFCRQLMWWCWSWHGDVS
jgi:hypothetical protein